MPRSKPRREEELRRSVDQLLAWADRVASSAKVNAGERETLLKWQRQLIMAVDSLVEIFAGYQAMHLGNHWQEPLDPDGPTHLDIVISATLTLAYHAIENPITQRLAREVVDANIARLANAKRDKSRQADGIILSVCLKASNRTLTANSLAIAKVQEINALRKASNLRPLGTSAIGKKIREMRKAGKLPL